MSEFQCVKCENDSYKTGELRASGGFWTKFFNIQNEKYKTLTCQNCGFTEMYNTDTSTAENVLDFFGN